MKEAGALLARGESVIVFPEGTRSKGDAMGEFKHGAFKMAFGGGVRPWCPSSSTGAIRSWRQTTT